MTQRDSGRMERLLVSFVVAGSFLRLLVCFQHNPQDYLFSDPLRHWQNGALLLHPDIMGTSNPILYQLYVHILRLLTGDNRYWVALACGVLSVITPWTYYRASRECGLGRRRALLVWALIAWTPSLFAIYHYMMMETLLLPLIGTGLWMTARSMRKGSLGSWLAAVFCWTLACLTKASAVPLAGVCLLYSWWVTGTRIKHAGAAVLLVGVLLLPNAIRTRYYLGVCAPLGSPWIVKVQHYSGAREIRVACGRAKYRFASPSVAVQPLAPLSPWAIRRAWEKSVVSVEVDTATWDEDWRRFYRSLDVGWRERSLQLLENAVLFAFSPSWPDSDPREWGGWASYHFRWIWLPLVLFVLGCNLRAFLQREVLLLPVAVTAFTLFLAFQNAATMEGRYRKPLEPLLVMNCIWATVPCTVGGRAKHMQPGSRA